MTILKGKVGGQWVPLTTAGPPGPGVPAGGATNSILIKTSAADYATAWNTSITVQDLTALNNVGVFGSVSSNGPITVNSNSLNLSKGQYVNWGGLSGITIDISNALWLGQGAASVEIAKPTQVTGTLNVTGNATAGNFSTAGTLYWGRGNWIQSNVGGILAMAVGAGADNTVYLGGNVPVAVLGNLTVNGTFTSTGAVRAAANINGGTGAIASGFGFASCTRLGVGVYQIILTTAVNSPIVVVTTTGASPPAIYTVEIGSTSLFAVRSWNTAYALVDSWFFVTVASP